MKTRIAHFADTHLGYRQYSLSEREMDFYKRFDEIIDDMIEKEVDCVIHSGDLFESPKPPINALLTAQKGFMKLLSNNIPIYVIAGNHDKLQRTGTEIPQRLFENENFHIIEKGKTYEINEDIFIGGLQYIQPQYQNSINEFIEEIKEKAEGYKYKILVLHGGIDKYDDFSKELELNTVSEGFDYYAMGHIHKRITGPFKEGLLSYPGSTELRTKKEWLDYKEQSKGYNLVTFDDVEKNIDVEYVNIPLKREMVIKKIDYPQLEEELQKIKEKIINHKEKPLVDLTVRNGDFVKSDVVEKIYEVIGDYCLSIRVTAEPIIGPGPDIENIPKSTEKTLHDYVKESFGESIANFSVSAYMELKIPNVEEAIRLSENLYQKVKEGTVNMEKETNDNNNDTQEDE